MRAARTVTDPRPLPVQVAEADLIRRILRRDLLSIEQQMIELPDFADVDELASRWDDVHERLEWANVHYYLLHDQMTEHRVPEELRLRPQRAA